MNQTELKELLDYDPETGVFTWIRPKAHCVKPGSIAGFLHKDGYHPNHGRTA